MRAIKKEKFRGSKYSRLSFKSQQLYSSCCRYILGVETYWASGKLGKNEFWKKMWGGKSEVGSVYHTDKPHMQL